MQNQYPTNYTLAINESSLPKIQKSKPTIYDAMKEPKLAKVEQLIENQGKHLNKILSSIVQEQKAAEKAERERELQREREAGAMSPELDLSKLKVSARDPETHVYKRHNHVAPSIISNKSFISYNRIFQSEKGPYPP